MSFLNWTYLHFCISKLRKLNHFIMLASFSLFLALLTLILEVFKKNESKELHSLPH